MMGFEARSSISFGTRMYLIRISEQASWVIYDAELGYRLNPGQRGINSLSLREREVTIPKPHGLYRVVVLGDSIPWDRGGFVELMSARRADQPQFEIINSSVPGYTSYQELVFFKRYLP